MFLQEFLDAIVEAIGALGVELISLILSLLSLIGA